MSSLFENAIGTLTGMIGAIGGMGCFGLMIVSGFIFICCVGPALFLLFITYAPIPQ